MADEYRLIGRGSRNRGERIDGLVIEGTSTNPDKILRIGGPPVELTDEQVEAYRARGYNLRKVGETEDSSSDNESGDNATDSTEKSESEQQDSQSPQSPAATRTRKSPDNS